MKGLVPYETTKSDLEYLSTQTDMGSIHRFIRLRADAVNPCLFTINALAARIGVAPSTISKFETSKQRKINSLFLAKVAKDMSVPLDAFYLDYYRNSPQPFTICGITSTVMNFDILAPAYRSRIQLESYSPAGVPFSKLDEVLELSVLEFEEMQREVQFIIDKVRERRKSWPKKRETVEQLKQWQHGETHHDRPNNGD